MRKRPSWTASWKRPHGSWARLGSEMDMPTFKTLAQGTRWAVKRFERGLQKHSLLPRRSIPVRAKEEMI
jgi:hypothetical protein